MTVEPYYEEDGITLYHANCHVLVDSLPFADLLLTDPPYGIGVNTDWTTRRPVKWAKGSRPVVGDDTPFEPSHLSNTAPKRVIWGGNYFADRLPPSSCWLVWDKRRGGTVTPGWNAPDAELAWTNLPGGVRVFVHLWEGYKRDSEVGEHYHPTQKPVALMKWVIDRWTEPGDLVLDPYCGMRLDRFSGKVGLCCRSLIGRQWPTLVGAVETTNLRVNGMVVWDKVSYGLGNGFRAQHELVLFASKGTPRVVDRGTSNVLAFRRSENEEHPSPKPVALMKALLGVVSEPGDLILDPFMGAGATLVAAKESGRRAIGIEVEERYCEVAVQRIAQGVLFEAAA